MRKHIYDRGNIFKHTVYARAAATQKAQTNHLKLKANANGNPVSQFLTTAHPVYIGLYSTGYDSIYNTDPNVFSASYNTELAKHY